MAIGAHHFVVLFVLLAIPLEHAESAIRRALNFQLLALRGLHGKSYSGRASVHVFLPHVLLPHETGTHLKRRVPQSVD